MKLLVWQISPSSCFFLSLTPTYFLQQFIPKHRTCLTFCETTEQTTCVIQKPILIFNEVSQFKFTDTETYPNYVSCFLYLIQNLVTRKVSLLSINLTDIYRGSTYSSPELLRTVLHNRPTISVWSK
jgi:hypothetical protein